LVARDKLKWIPFILIPWAIFVSISRVYLGVHYPTDIIVPAILSIPIAFIVARIYEVYNPSLIKKIT
jgi:undecaprenyl-diphosphatase